MIHWGLIRPAEGELRATRDWAAGLLALLEQPVPLKSLLGVEDDILGVYEYEKGFLLSDERTVNRAKIRLHWAVIGLVAE